MRRFLVAIIAAVITIVAGQSALADSATCKRMAAELGEGKTSRLNRAAFTNRACSIVQEIIAAKFSGSEEHINACNEAFSAHGAEYVKRFSRSFEPSVVISCQLSFNLNVELK